MTRLERIADLATRFPDGRMGHSIEALKNMTDAHYEAEQADVRAAAGRMANDLFKKLGKK